jgi:hypothetical protein
LCGSRIGLGDKVIQMAPVAQRDREQLSMLENKRAMYETITMNYRQKVQRLTRLQDMDPDLLLKEIDQPWPGMEADMEVALAIMRTCQENGERMSLLESFHIDEKADKLWFQLPAWQMKIMEEFRSLFDEDEAQYRYLKTMNELISKRLAGGHLN